MLKRLARYILREELQQEESIRDKLAQTCYDTGFRDGWKENSIYHQSMKRNSGVILGKYRREIEGILENNRW